MKSKFLITLALLIAMIGLVASNQITNLEEEETVKSVDEDHFSTIHRLL